MFDEKFWLAIAFLAFAILLAKYVWPHIAKALDANSRKIAEDLLAAKEMKEKAEKLLKDAEKFLQESEAFATKLTSDAENEASKIAEDAQNALEEEIKKKTDSAISRIKTEEGRMTREIKIQIVNSAIDQLSQGSNFNSADQEKLIEKSIKNLETH
jgi:ATP synthase F0 subunit b